MKDKELEELLVELLKKDESDSYIEFKADLEPYLIGEYYLRFIKLCMSKTYRFWLFSFGNRR